MSQSGELTEPLERWQAGDEDALKEITPLIYDELRRIAARRLRRDAGRYSLQTTDLVHEVYLKMAGNTPQLQDRTHFLAVVSRLMRQVLVDHARRRTRKKRGGSDEPVQLDEALHQVIEAPHAVIRLDEALSDLARLEPRVARTIELHYFGGMNYDEIGSVLNLSRATVNRDLQLGRAWLRRELLK